MLPIPLWRVALAGGAVAVLIAVLAIHTRMMYRRAMEIAEEYADMKADDN